MRQPLKPAKRTDSPLYVRIAQAISGQVANGSLRPGDRVPSLRQLSADQGVSVSTTLKAYMWLENQGYLEARPQSGFYVRTPFASLIPEPAPLAYESQPAMFGTSTVLQEVIRSANNPDFIPFGAGCASPELLPNNKLNLLLRRVIARQPQHSAKYDFPPGLEGFRRQISRRLLAIRCEAAPRDVVVTSGALEAVNLGLRAVARPGDIIAVESPTFFGILESVSSLGMKIVEIPAHPNQGIDLERLDRAIRQHKIKACVITSNCQNPLGFVQTNEQKRALVELTARSNVAVIEDDLYGDLAFASPRPLTAKSFDRNGLVLLCSSFSKILLPGYRVGWILAGRFQAEVERIKFTTTMAAPSLASMVLAEFLATGGYDRYLRRFRAVIANQVERTRQSIGRYFPSGTRVSRPAGGYMLWVEMPKKVDAIALHRSALAEGISILPGNLFSASGRYKNYIRISCGRLWVSAHEKALETLGRLSSQQL
jgi:DNA-binding transcriptional MocR family regulator